MYLDPYDAAKEPHSAKAKDGWILETPEPSSWAVGQRLVADWFNAHAVDGMVPPDTPIDALGTVIGYVHKLACEPEGNDFRYVIYGRSIARKANMGGDGVRVSELIEPTASIMLRHYRALAAQPRFFAGRLTYAGVDIPNRDWIRADAPLGRPETGISHFIVFTDTAQDARYA